MLGTTLALMRGVSLALGGRLRRIRDLVGIARETARDGFRYARLSAPSDGASGVNVGPRQLECQITKDYHRIEKGLALPSPKVPFGRDVERRLRRDLARYLPMDGSDPEVVELGRTALGELVQWNAGEGFAENATKKAVEVNSLSPDVLASFFNSRSSVRDFAARDVDPELIRTAVGLARATPSVCNRQAWAVHAFHDPARRVAVLELQNGNAGFRHKIPCVLVVGVDVRLFAGSGERNQRWVDGGMFAMSLVWALHGMGLASCMLNWSVEHAQTAMLRMIAGLPDYEDVITLIAVGHPLTDFRVARSRRRPVDDIFRTDGHG